jgi:hypothetical protein
MNPEKKFDLYTATPEEIVVCVDREHRKKNNNALSKRQELSDLRWRILDENRLMLNVIDFDHKGRTPEKIAAHRRYCQAEIDWLTANPGDDLTPEVVALWRKFAREDLPRCEELKAAVTWCEEVEEYSPHDPDFKPSETLRKLRSKLSDAVADARRHLTYALALPDFDFLCALQHRSWTGRGKRWWRFQDLRDYRARKHWELRDLSIVAFGLAQSFDSALHSCRTLAEVKRVCAIWDCPVKVERRDGASFVLGDGFEVIPQ